MVKHTQTIRRIFPTNCLSVFDHFVGLALKGLSTLQEWFSLPQKLLLLLLKIIKSTLDEIVDIIHKIFCKSWF